MNARVGCKDEYCVGVSEWGEKLLLINKIALYFYVNDCFFDYYWNWVSIDLFISDGIQEEATRTCRYRSPPSLIGGCESNEG